MDTTYNMYLGRYFRNWFYLYEADHENIDITVLFNSIKTNNNNNLKTCVYTILDIGIKFSLNKILQNL